MITPGEKQLQKGAIMQKQYITDFAWQKIYDFLLQTEGVYTRNESRSRAFMEAIYWMMRTGAQWRELPEYYGQWNSIYKRFDRWSAKGIWYRLLVFCANDPDLEYVSFDATIIRAHPCAAGHGKQDEQGLGRSKGGFTTKIHALVDALGNPLRYIITPGQVADVTQTDKLLADIVDAYALGDKGYDSDKVRADLRSRNCTPVIPGRSNRQEPIEYDKHIYKERHVIECFFSKIKQFRRIFSRFDKKLLNYFSFLCFSGAIIWLR
jgi:transposase